MATKIETYVSTAADGARGSPKPAEAVARSSSGSGTVPNVANVARIDSVKFTPNAMQLQQMEASIAKIPVADHKRVAEVRLALENGSYRIDAKAIASKLARMEWDLTAK